MTTDSNETPEAPKSLARIFCYRFFFPPEAEDINGHVNNVEYVRKLQEAAIAHTHQNGWHTEELQEHGWTWVVRSHKIEYLRSCRAGEPIALYTWVHDFKKIRSLRRYRFVRESDGAILAEAETDWIFLDFNRGRPVAIPDSVRAIYSVIPEDEEKTIGKS